MAIEINSDEEFQILVRENELSIVNFYTNNNQCWLALRRQVRDFQPTLVQLAMCAQSHNMRQC